MITVLAAKCPKDFSDIEKFQYLIQCSKGEGVDFNTDITAGDLRDQRYRWFVYDPETGTVYLNQQLIRWEGDKTYSIVEVKWSEFEEKCVDLQGYLSEQLNLAEELSSSI